MAEDREAPPSGSSLAMQDNHRRSRNGRPPLPARDTSPASRHSDVHSSQISSDMVDRHRDVMHLDGAPRAFENEARRQVHHQDGRSLLSYVGLEPLSGVGERGRHEAPARGRNGLSQGMELGTVQDVTEPGATALEVSMIHQAKLAANKVQSFCLNQDVQKVFGYVAVLFLLLVAGRCIQSALSGGRYEIDAFLRTVGMQQYTADFADKGYSSVHDILIATDQDLLEYVGITVVPHRRRILHLAQERMRPRSLPPALVWTFCIMSGLVVIGTGVATAISAQARERIFVISMFCGLMTWHRLRMWARLWTTLDIRRSPKLHSEMIEEPLVVELRRTVTGSSVPSSAAGQLDSHGNLPASNPAATEPNSRNSSRRLLSRLRKNGRG
ncbi:unnamed protein product [Ostreobium quekettii]|uniref:SAM domain-containing protein n=1 Tax=Ostreobium quekettii TaxID=121088 RepID=A0A8S1IKU6_9CHLO|nr:unnamed protein product [Ostreobium quekettii]